MTGSNITINDSTNALVTVGESTLLNLSTALLGSINSAIGTGETGDTVTYLNTTTGTMAGIEIAYSDFSTFTTTYPNLTFADLWAQTAASASNSVTFTK